MDDNKFDKYFYIIGATIALWLYYSNSGTTQMLFIIIPIILFGYGVLNWFGHINSSLIDIKEELEALRKDLRVALNYRENLEKKVTKEAHEIKKQFSKLYKPTGEQKDYPSFKTIDNFISIIKWITVTEEKQNIPVSERLSIDTEDFDYLEELHKAFLRININTS